MSNPVKYSSPTFAHIVSSIKGIFGIIQQGHYALVFMQDIGKEEGLSLPLTCFGAI